MRTAAGKLLVGLGFRIVVAASRCCCAASAAGSWGCHLVRKHSSHILAYPARRTVRAYKLPPASCAVGSIVRTVLRTPLTYVDD